VVEAWRSPYFDWRALQAEKDAAPAAGLAADADALDAAARWGLVIGGLAQWREVLERLASRAAGENALDEDQATPAGVPVGAAASALSARFERFVERITPPEGPAPVRAYVGWLENLIGPDPAAEAQGSQPAPHLDMVKRAREGSVDLAERDVAALRVVKDVLRGLVWAEEAVSSGEGVTFPRFFEELAGAVDAASYRLPARPGRDEIVVANVFQARGVGFCAAAVLGLAEGEFPTTVHEDPFLRDADRKRLTGGFHLELPPSTDSAEAELFYEAVTRPRERLLLTRPRLADGGALWQASPFWEEVRRQVRVEPARMTSESLPLPTQAASWPELMEGLASGAGDGALRAWAGRQEPGRQTALEAAVEVLQLRGTRMKDSAFDGDLRGMADALALRFGPDHVWSPSRLEGYRACPFLFFVGTVLGLEPREEPEEGLNVAQRGTIYHRILEQVYQDRRVLDPLDVEQLLAVLPDVADAILDAAPEEEGFRETAWWAQTRREIVAEIEGTLRALAQQPGDFVPCRFEARFGLGGEAPLQVFLGSEGFLLHGVIDRIDRSAGGQLRVIDYKSAGPTTYSNKAVMEGKKLQLPLYALAARDALRLGEPADGFYWHVRHAVPSSFRLSGGVGPEAAMLNAAQKAWEAVQGARAGEFAPQPPDDGCPGWCAASAFCWHYRPRFGG
jgi:RecB family exonuclease